MKEREISLFDLIIEVLLHWRGILLVTLLGGICIGGLGYVQSYQTSKAKYRQELFAQAGNTLMAVQKDLDELEFSDIDKSRYSDVNMVIMFERLYQDRLAFCEEASVLMSLNPNKVWKAYATFLIEAGDLERAYNIEKAYENILCSGGLFEYLGTKHGMETSAVSEIVALENELPRRETGTDSPRNSFRLTVVHFDESVCKSLAMSMVNYVTEQEQRLQQELGEHSVTVLEQSQALVADMDVLNRQKIYISDTASYMTLAANTKDAFTKAEQKYYVKLIAETRSEEIGTSGDEGSSAQESGSGQAAGETAEALQPIAQISSSLSLRHILLGMTFGAFAYAVAIFIRYIMNNKIQYTDDVYMLYNLPQLGRIPGKGTRHPLGAVDRWLVRLRNWDKRSFTSEEAVDLAAASVKIAARKRGLGTITLIGCDIKGDTLLTCRRISGLLEKDGIGTEILSNILYDAESMERLNSAEAVVLVEKAGSTLYTEISKECALLERQGIAVLGGIVQG